MVTIDRVDNIPVLIVSNQQMGVAELLNKHFASIYSRLADSINPPSI